MILSWLLLGDSTLPVPEVRHLDDYTIYPPEFEIFEVWLYPLFELCKILRGIFIFWIAYNYFYNTKTTILSSFAVQPVFFTQPGLSYSNVICTVLCEYMLILDMRTA